ncbi:hypothetical protein [Nonomuraea sp. NPDC050783]|uniref:hypothetical protein n=1 Tax=Nonomuraea sp. NPDC050783 TaxID=3154634 RepID=UPI003465DC23
MRTHLIVPLAALVLANAPAAPEVVDYTCTTVATGEKQNIKVSVELDVPPTGTVQENLTIGWKGSYSGSTQLIAPVLDVEAGLNLYAYVGISRIDKLTSATGVAQLTGVTAGAPIVLPTTTVNLTTTPQGTGKGTVHVGAINFGSSPQERVIECEVTNTNARTEHPLEITAAGASSSPSPTPTPTPTSSATPTDDDEPDEEQDPEVTPEESETPTRTPEGGVATGGGGEAGPDGRPLILTGSFLLLASAAGFALRRRRGLSAQP